MKTVEIKDRVSKVDERIVALVKRYPFVFGVLVVGAGGVGFLLGKFL